MRWITQMVLFCACEKFIFGEQSVEKSLTHIISISISISISETQSVGPGQVWGHARQGSRPYFGPGSGRGVGPGIDIPSTGINQGTTNLCLILATHVPCSQPSSQPSYCHDLLQGEGRPSCLQLDTEYVQCSWCGTRFLVLRVDIEYIVHDLLQGEERPSCSTSRYRVYCSWCTIRWRKDFLFYN